MSNSTRFFLTILVAIVSVVAGGCAQNGADSLIPQIGQKVPDRHRAGEVYELSAQEKSLSCKQLTGRMQLRILQARDTMARNDSSALGRGLQSVTVPVFGGTSHGTDPAADFARDRAMLEAYNQQLTAKKCPAYDLEAEMRPRPVRDTPTPVPNPAIAAKPK